MHSRSRRRALALLSAATFGVLPQLSFAQEYPDKPVKLIVPFPAGGGADNLARLVMARVSRELGQSIIIDNRPGAGGNIGAVAAAKSAPDGYTLFYGTNGTHGINKSLYSQLGFDPVKDFAPVTQMSRIAAMMTVNPKLGVNSMAELLTLLKKNPGKYTYGSAGNGTTSHLTTELLKQAAGVSIVHIPYRGGGAAMVDLLGGQIDMLFDVTPSTGPQVRAGKVNALAVSTAQRAPGFPNVPTIAESGLAGFDVSAWDAIFVPAGTPQPIIERLNKAIHGALADPALRQALNDRGSAPSPGTPQELAKLIDKELTVWGSAVKRSGAKVD
ncbi:MAG: tripartite tricarboxylate transporter substrate binding protein [Pseudomonadota bacterium]